MAVQDRADGMDQESEQRRQISESSLQRRAMAAMLLAMLVMAIGLPHHMTAFGNHGDHAVSRIVVWLSILLTLGTLSATRHTLFYAWQSLRHGRLGSTELVTICALGALVASLPTLAIHSAPMYFDVTAMSLAWIVAGEAQSAAIYRRCSSRLEQLAPLNLPALRLGLPAPWRSDRSAAWPGSVIGGFAAVTLVLHALLSESAVRGLLVGLSAVAMGCPCTLGIVKSTAWEAGVERAAAFGWLVPSGEAVSRIAETPHLVAQLVVAPGAADLRPLVALAGAVNWTIRLNYLWAVGLNLALLPLALIGPLPSIVPATTMVIARLLIFFTTRRLRSWGTSSLESAEVINLGYNHDDA